MSMDRTTDDRLDRHKPQSDGQAQAQRVPTMHLWCVEKNRGECVNTPGSYSCSCGPGFTGVHCETLYIPCSPSPCLNGGTCRQTSETTYSCHCLPAAPPTRGNDTSSSSSTTTPLIQYSRCSCKSTTTTDLHHQHHQGGSPDYRADQDQDQDYGLLLLLLLLLLLYHRTF
ncbi:hypothetical protein CRUP_025065 [Coryphaenoides rupestris]|nr:hypothetical protein CRUP_025065 [Coryphaenoides rupestris]